MGLRRFHFPDDGCVNRSLTITAIAMRTADRIKVMVSRGELEKRAKIYSSTG